MPNTNITCWPSPKKADLHPFLAKLRHRNPKTPIPLPLTESAQTRIVRGVGGEVLFRQWVWEAGQMALLDRLVVGAYLGC